MSEIYYLFLSSTPNISSRKYFSHFYLPMWQFNFSLYQSCGIKAGNTNCSFLKSTVTVAFAY